MTKYYTGVGSRDISKEEADFIRDIAYKLKQQGWILRSGAADGADSAFWEGACKFYREDYENIPRGVPEEIYLPWDNFHGYSVSSPWGCFYTPDSLNVVSECQKLVSKIHPAWDRLKSGARKMHTRNVLQVLGRDVKTPSKFLIACSDPDNRGGVKGGTATAWNLARANGVPCFNVRDKKDRDKLARYLSE